MECRSNRESRYSGARTEHTSRWIDTRSRGEKTGYNDTLAYVVKTICTAIKKGVSKLNTYVFRLLR